MEQDVVPLLQLSFLYNISGSMYFQNATTAKTIIHIYQKFIATKILCNIYKDKTAIWHILLIWCTII